MQALQLKAQLGTLNKTKEKRQKKKERPLGSIAETELL